MKCIKQYQDYFTTTFSLLVFAFIGIGGAFAQSPHDHIDALEVSPDYKHDIAAVAGGCVVLLQG